MADRSEKMENLEPLVIFYDSEAANGKVYYGDVIEIAATCHPGVVVGSFERLINTKQPLGSFAINQSGITEDMLKGKPFIDEVMVKFLDWIEEMVALAQKKNSTNYFPVLCAHGGYQFDFLILFANLERKGVSYKKFKDYNIHFADSFLFCQQLQQDGNQYLKDTRLSIDGLFHNFFPKHTIKERHRAMGDVKAMVKIFTQTPLKNVLHLMSASTTQERVKYFVSQSSAKEQQLILDEKFSSLDACSRNMNSKRLIREGMTYDILKIVFQNCSSYMEFWQLLKKIGIERKVAKHLTSHFGALGLENQGSLGYNLHIAKQNGTMSNGSFQATDGNINGNTNGNPGLEISLMDSISSSKVQNSDRNKNKDPSKVNAVMGNKQTDRATSSSKAFEERPLDYAVTSSADERPKVYATKSSQNLDIMKDPCENSHVVNAVNVSSLETGQTANARTDTYDSAIESVDSKSVSLQNSCTSEDSSICNGNENWDAEIENSVNRGHFILQFDEVIPVSIGIEDITSSSEVLSKDQHDFLKQKNMRKAAALSGEIKSEKRFLGKNKELRPRKKNDSGVTDAHRPGQSKTKNELSVKVNKGKTQETRESSTCGKRINDKSKITAIPSKDKEEKCMSSSEGKEGLSNLNNINELINDRANGGKLSKLPVTSNDETPCSSLREIQTKEFNKQNSLKTKRRKKVSSTKKPSSVTFVTPKDSVGRTSVESCSEKPADGLDMTTVYIGDVAIFVPLEKQYALYEDIPDKVVPGDKKEVEADNSIFKDESDISKGESAIPRDENTISRSDSTISRNNNVISRNAAVGTEDHVNIISLKQSEECTVVKDKSCLVDSRKVDNFDQEATDLDKKTPINAVEHDRAPSTSTSESLSSYDTSDTCSSLDFRHQTEPPLIKEKRCESGTASDELHQSSDVDNGLVSRNQESELTQGNNHAPVAHPTDQPSSNDVIKEDMMVKEFDSDSKKPCNSLSPNEVQQAIEEGSLPLDPSGAIDTNSSVPQEQLNGFTEECWPNRLVLYPNSNMYPMPTPQYPFHMPYHQTAVPTGYGFYPSVPHTMPMIPGPQGMQYPSIPFGPQGVVPFGRFQPRFAMPMPMFGPSLYYHHVQEEAYPHPNSVTFEQECMQHNVRSSPDVLGIPDNGNQAYEHLNNTTSPGNGSGITSTNESYSTSSDERSGRISPFPAGDCSNKTTPFTTPHSSPVDDNSPCTRPSGEAHFSKDKRRGYRKSSKDAKRFQRYERSPRGNRYGTGRGNSLKDKENKKNLPEKMSVNREVYECNSTESYDVSLERKKTKASDRKFKEEKHSPIQVKQSDDKDVKSDPHSPKTPTKSLKFDQLTPPRRGETDRDSKSNHGTPTKSYQIVQPRKVEKNVKSDHATSQLSPTDSRTEQQTIQKKAERDVTSDLEATQPTKGLKSEQLRPQKGTQMDDERDHATRKTPSINSRSKKTSKFSSSPKYSSARTSLNDTSKPSQFSSTTKRPLNDPIESPNSSGKNPNHPLPSSKISSPAQTDAGVSTNNDKLPQEASNSLGNSPKSDKNAKWPQSALVTQKFREQPKPQREVSARRRVRESHGSGLTRRVESRQGSATSHKNEEVDKSPKATGNDVIDEKRVSKTAIENRQSKEPFSASGKDLKSKIDGQTKKESTDHNREKRSTNYRDILLGKQSTTIPGNEKSVTAESNGIRYTFNTSEQRPSSKVGVNLSSKENTCSDVPNVDGQDPLASGTIKNRCSTPQTRDQDRRLEKNYEKEKKPLENPPLKEGKPISTIRDSTIPRGSTISRDSSPRANSRTRRNRQYDTNNNSNMQSRNTASNATKR